MLITVFGSKNIDFKKIQISEFRGYFSPLSKWKAGDCCRQSYI
ncbi:hypothetical protein A33Q_2191 [Indibacter alkaliphilus LW1]|uniref:Uncharacterized protein n=1 Tax=Indibacter alkaliphilus (strain CCUG 57479 / KCTC 22604 / LW1) TaxID=1189612 RepID=S2DXM9_INDAL|nr:hypothetical protein A33Q_2191 [Indibacter alkaliphilus LW1]